MSTSINFGSCSTTRIPLVHPSLAGNSVRHTTCFFRSDLNWHTLTDNILSSPIKDIYAGACSDGSEVISLKMLLEKKAPKRKFNFMAFDIANDKIKTAQEGIVEIWDGATTGGYYCLERCAEYVGNEIFNKNLRMVKVPANAKKQPPKERDGEFYQMTKHLCSNLSFYRADILKVTSQKFEEPVAFLFRNVWPYLKESVQNKAAHNLEQNLPSQSILALGEYDNSIDPYSLLRKQYFDGVGYSEGQILRHK